MVYKDLIKIVEKRRNKLYREYKKTIFFKKIKKAYLDKYDNLLLKLYTKLENID